MYYVIVTLFRLVYFKYLLLCIMKPKKGKCQKVLKIVSNKRSCRLFLKLLNTILHN